MPAKTPDELYDELPTELPTELPATELPHALGAIDTIVARLRQGRPMIFLDYDGTLSPIVERPQDAVLTEAMRACVARLARTCPVAVVSGRDLSDVRSRVGVEGIAYAGSHGFDVLDADGESLDPGDATRFLPMLDRAERELAARLSRVDGMRLERKRFSLAVHYRQVPADSVDAVRAQVERVLREVGGLRCSHGKKVLDLQPDIDWHKGRALTWLLQEFSGSAPGPAVIPFYIGDDTTDEDAFRAVQRGGVGVAVRDDDRPTAARYRVRDPDEVQELLEALAEGLDAPAAAG